MVLLEENIVGMLDFPDLFDTLDKNIRSQIDFDKCDSMDLDKIKNVDFEKRNRQEVSKILKKYIKSYTDNGNYEEKRNEIKKYASEYLDKEYPISPKTAMNIHMGMNELQFYNIFMKIPLQAFVLYVELMKCAYTYIHEKYITKEKSETINIDCHFIAYSLELLSGLNVLLVSDNYNSVISIYRTFYENFIVFSFIHKHTELIDDFLLHKRIIELKMKIEASELDNSSVDENIRKEYYEILKNQEDGFSDNYGWTAKVLKKEDRKLKQMYEVSELAEPFGFFYKLSCKYSHSTAYSLFVRPNFKDLINFLHGIMYIIKKEYTVLIGELNMIQKDKILLEEWVNAASDNLKSILDDWENVVI